MRNHDYWVYILSNKHCTTLYIGITNNIVRRLYQHRYAEVKGFTRRYHFGPARLARALSQRERRDRLGEEAKGLAPQQENCAYRANEAPVARPE
jgi:predicted GIY-YIG superfamily endonuclease